jgi:WD40 repeat protein
MRAIAILLLLAAATACGGRSRSSASAREDVCGPPLPDPASAEPPRQVVQRRHAGAISALAWSDDGAYLATASPDGARVWQVATRALVRSLVRGERGGRPPFLAWDADGHLVFGAEDAIAVDVARDRDVGRFGWELEAINGSKYQAEIRAPVRVGGPGPTAWVAAGPSGLWRFDAHRGRLAKLAPPAGVYGYEGHLTAAPDGSAVASASDTTAYVWRIGGDDSAAPVALPIARPAALALFPGGDRLLLAAGAAPGDTRGASSVSIVPLAGGPPTPLPDPGAWVRDAALSADGALAAAAGGEKLVVWDVAAARVLWSREARYDGDIDATYTRVSFSPDGRRVAVVTLGGDIAVLDARTGRRHGSLGVDVRVPYHAVFAGDDTLVVASAAHLTTWSLADGRRDDARSFRLEDLVTIAPLGDDLLSIRSKPLVDTIASLDGSCDDQDGIPLYVDRWRGAAPPDALPDHDDLDHDEALAAPAWPPTGGLARRARCLPGASLQDIAPARGLALVTSDDGAPTVVDLRTGAAVAVAVEPGLFVASFGLSPDGRWVTGVSGIGIGSAHVWDAATGAEVARIQVEDAGENHRFLGAHNVAVSPDGATLAVSFGPHVELHPLPSGARQARVTDGARVTALRFGAGGLYVGGADGTLALVRDGALAPLGRGGDGSIQRIAVSPSGARVATLDDDGAVRVWSPGSRAVAAALLDFGDDEWAAVTPGGAYRGTDEASEHVGWVFSDPLEHFRFEQFTAYRDAALVARRLGDGKSDVARAVRRPPAAHLTATAIAGGTSARLEAKVASGTRVDRVRFFVEGRLAAERPVCRAGATVAASVPLRAGANRITAVAFDDRGFASNPATADLVSSTAARPDLHVVAVGVSAYPHLAATWQLQAADDDARAVVQRLAARAGAGKEYARAHTTLLLDQEVTVDAVRAALRGLAVMKPDDVAVVFLAGHGFKRSQDGDMVFVTGALRNLADPASAGIAWRDIADLLAAAPGRVLVLLDACHAGHVNRELVVPNNALAASLSRQGRAGVVVFAASKGRQLSYETSGSRALRHVKDDRARPAAAGAPQHGIFTRALLDALDAPATDRDGDGAVQLSELVDAVTASVIERTEGLQTPWVARREIFGDWSVAAACYPGRGCGVR